jgi:hypothetical protein
MEGLELSLSGVLEAADMFVWNVGWNEGNVDRRTIMIKSALRSKSHLHMHNGTIRQVLAKHP